MNHGSLFSGIGGFDLAAEWMGWKNVFHCEINPFCQKVLKKHWPEAILYEDIKKTDFNEWQGKIGIISGGFPCQPYSVAGKRKGNEDDRHLWPEMLRAIREIQPTWIVGENVPGLINWSKGLVFEQMQTDLENSGFEIFPPLILPACSTNAPHKRNRFWIVANRNGKPGDISIQQWRQEKKTYANTIGDGSEESFTNLDCSRIQRREASRFIKESRAIGNELVRGFNQFNNWDEFPTQSPICGRNDGIPNRVDRIKAIGNAVVPQVVYQIFKAIEQYENNPPQIKQ